MKLRDPRWIRRVAWVAAKLIRLWMGTIRYRSRFPATVEPGRPDSSGRYMFLFWHEHLLTPVNNRGWPNVHVLIGQHADGELIAQVAGHLGFSTVRGSSSRGAREAVRSILRLGDGSHLVVTPDGPRGPRHQLPPTLIFLAAKTGMPIVPVSVGYRRVWRANSWDRFAVPLPFGGTYLVALDPIVIPTGLDGSGLSEWAGRVESAMAEAGRLAEAWSSTNRLPDELKRAPIPVYRPATPRAA